MEIRKFEKNDYDEVYHLWMSCKNMGFNTVDDTKEAITKFICKNPDTCFVACKEDKIIGTVLAGNDGRRGYVYHMCVAENERQSQIGTKLLEHMLEGMKKEGISKVGLTVFAKNEVGNKFWEKNGFIKRDDIYYRNIQLVDMVRIDT